MCDSLHPHNKIYERTQRAIGAWSALANRLRLALPVDADFTMRHHVAYRSRKAARGAAEGLANQKHEGTEDVESSEFDFGERQPVGYGGACPRSGSASA